VPEVSGPCVSGSGRLAGIGGAPAAADGRMGTDGLTVIGSVANGPLSAPKNTAFVMSRRAACR
jgi:hypothetical protein